MILRKFLRGCCPEDTDRRADRLYQKAQFILMKLRDETRTLMKNADWSRKHQNDTENEQVIDVNEVGEACQYHGRMNLDKFKKLTRDERAQWIDYNDRLLAIANQILKDTEASVQVLHTLKEILTLVIEPIEVLSKRPAARVRIRSLRETYFKYARALKSDARIRLRYLRILNDSHSEELLATWNSQLQKELDRSSHHTEIFDDFLSTTRAIIDDIIQDVGAPTSQENALKRRHETALVKSKKDILQNRQKTNTDQAETWKTRGQAAAKENRSVLAAEASRRTETFETCALLYQDCCAALEKLYDHMSKGLQEFQEVHKTKAGT